MANLLEKASIILTPTAYSDGKMHSAKPIVSTNPSIGDFDFARASVATRVNEQGLIEEVASGLPRIDYTDGSGSWLLEPTVTNLVVQSQVFSGYTADNEIVTDNSIVSPDGTVTGAILADSGLGGISNVQIYEGVTVDASSTYTYSVFAKKKDLNFIALRTASFTTPSDGQSYFDLNLGTTLGVATGHTSKIENYGNGWYRCSITFTTDAVDTTGNIFTRLSQNGTTSSVDLDNTSNAYIWGFQFEKNSYATSYIKNAGTALGVTRVADTATGSGNSTVINSAEGVLYAEISAFVDGGNFDFISLCDGGSANRCSIFFNGGNLSVAYRASDTNVFLHSQTANLLEFHKVAISYKQSEFKMFVDGVKVQEQLSGNVLSANTFDRLNFDKNDGSDNLFIGKTKSLQVYKTSLSDAELTSLTTI